MVTAHQKKYDPKPLLGTREDVKRYLADLAARNAARLAEAEGRRVVFRRTTLFSVLCIAVLQYYFLSVGLEMLSMPNLIVFLPAPGPQIIRPNV